MPATQLPEPYCSALKNSLVDLPPAAEAEAAARSFRSHTLSLDQMGVVELLLSGALSPVDYFHGARERQRILDDWQLINGVPWPLPLSLIIDGEEPALAQKIALRDPEGVLLATLMIDDVEPVEGGGWEVGGTLKAAARPTRHDFRYLRHTPKQLRTRFKERSWKRVMGVLTRSAVLTQDLNTIISAAREAEANWMVALLSTGGGVGDLAHFAGIRSTQAMLRTHKAEADLLTVLPLPVFTDRARELALRAIIARNCGCALILTDELVADEKLKALLEHVGIELAVTRPGFGMAAEVVSEILKDEEAVSANIAPEKAVAPWREVYRPSGELGFTVLFTGYCGAGKSTLANALAIRLQEIGGRRVTLLDGKLVREKLSSELGFSPEHRDLNIRRIGFVASEITKNGGIAICAPIAPLAEARAEVRREIEALGGFVEVHVSTSLEVCEQRDRKGLYAKARQGIIEDFTGISAPYEPPQNPELVIDTEHCTVNEGLETLVLKLKALGYLR